jgi:transcriptional regulator with XRE-family HTH domain
MVYFVSMSDNPKTLIDLTALRENAGLTVRGLARELGINHATLLNWEQTGRVAKAEFLLPMSSILGVTQYRGCRPRHVACAASKGSIKKALA